MSVTRTPMVWPIWSAARFNSAGEPLNAGAAWLASRWAVDFKRAVWLAKQVSSTHFEVNHPAASNARPTIIRCPKSNCRASRFRVMAEEVSRRQFAGGSRCGTGKRSLPVRRVPIRHGSLYCLLPPASCRLPQLLPKSIPDAADRFNVLAELAHFLPQAGHLHVDRALGDRIILPLDRIDDLRAG